MKHLLRLFVVVMLVTLLAAPLTVSAQGGANPLCQGLAQADCDLLLAAQTAMAGVTSVSTPNWSISLTLSLPNAETGAVQTINFAAKGSGGGLNLTPGAEVMVHLIVNEASITDGTVSRAGNAEVIVTPTMGYINFEGQWYGGEIEEGDLPVEDLASIGQIGDLGTALGGLGIDLSTVLTTTRSDDGGAALFTTQVNLGNLVTTLLASPMVGEMLGSAMGSESMTPEDLAMVGMFVTPLLATTTLSSYQAVGADNMITKIGLDLVLDIDLSMFAPEVGKITGEIHFMSEVAGYGGTLTPTIPTEFKPIEELENLDLGLDQLGAGLGL